MTECHEEVVRRGVVQPCDKSAVAMRRDVEDSGRPYPVCAYHARDPMMLLTDVQYDAWDKGFSARSAESMRQREDPEYPIHRRNPYARPVETPVPAKPCCDAETYDEHLENHHLTDTPNGL